MEGYNPNICAICKSPAQSWPIDGYPHRFECPRCGGFRIDHYVLIKLKHDSISQAQIANLSGYLRENQGTFLTNENFPRFLELPTPSAGRKAALLLNAIAKEWPRLGDNFMIDYWGFRDLDQKLQQGKQLNESAINSLKWLAIAYAQDALELEFLLRTFLMGQSYLTDGRANGWLCMTPLGWEKVEDFKSSKGSSNDAFVAMSFKPEFQTLYDAGLSLGISQAGYNPFRVDRHEHNNRIDDEIVARIKGSKFLVADFTVDRGGIYFEAGLAMGLAKQVVWTVREDALAEVHFDNRQYNFVVWKPEQLDQLAVRLKNRIEATIGRGPL